MPTELPRPRKFRIRSAKSKQTKTSLALNIFMLTSGLVLTYVVLVTEQRYAFGPRDNGVTTVEQSAEHVKIH